MTANESLATLELASRTIATEIGGQGLAPLRVVGREAETLGFRLPGSEATHILQAFVADRDGGRIIGSAAIIAIVTLALTGVVASSISF